LNLETDNSAISKKEKTEEPASHVADEAPDTERQGSEEMHCDQKHEGKEAPDPSITLRLGSWFSGLVDHVSLLLPGRRSVVMAERDLVAEDAE